MITRFLKTIGLLLGALSLVSCTYNPMVPNNHNTGSIEGRLIGMGVGGGTAAVLGAPTPIKILAGVTGGSVGYYMTTLRYDASGIYFVGGQVYQLGQKIGIYVPTDKLFQANTADFLPQATPVLDSIVAVLQRYPDNNILISGNTSGFSSDRFEQKLSEDRAKAVAAYLWDAGMSTYKTNSLTTRKLNYVGYGDYFPITSESNHSNQGIRSNSRIQITSYPSPEDLKLDRGCLPASDIGAYKDAPMDCPKPIEKCSKNLPGCDA